MWQCLATFEAFSRALRMDGYHSTCTLPAAQFAASCELPKRQVQFSDFSDACCLGFFSFYPVLQSTCHPYEVTRALSSVSLASLFPTLVTDRTALCARSARLRSRNGELARRYLPAMCTGEQRERRASA